MRNDESLELKGETLSTSLSRISECCMLHEEPQEIADLSLRLDPNGVIGSDASGLDRDFYDEISQSDGGK